jgi:hypothetical protein
MHQKDLIQRLEKLAYEKSTPFCYGCYCKAPTGRCVLCGSDDLMRELAGEGVEYDVDWIVQSLVRNNLTPVDAEEAFAESVSQCYPEDTKIGWLEVDTVTAIKSLDPVSWELAQSEWIDSEIQGGNFISFDEGSTCYHAFDLEQFLDQFESGAS